MSEPKSPFEQRLIELGWATWAMGLVASTSLTGFLAQLVDLPGRLALAMPPYSSWRRSVVWRSLWVLPSHTECCIQGSTKAGRPSWLPRYVLVLAFLFPTSSA